MKPTIFLFNLKKFILVIFHFNRQNFHFCVWLSVSLFFTLIFLWLIFENNNFEDNATRRKSSFYVYNYRSNILYGNREEAHLIEIFISPYYSWIGNKEKFNLDNHGNYTFVHTEFPLSHDGY